MSKLNAIIVNENGKKTIIYDGQEILPDDVSLTAEERVEVDSATYTPPSIPYTVTDLQIRLALTALGLRDSVENEVAASSQDVQDYWLRSRLFQRANPMLLEMAKKVGVNASGLDTLFIEAAKL